MSNSTKVDDKIFSLPGSHSLLSESVSYHCKLQKRTVHRAVDDGKRVGYENDWHTERALRIRLRDITKENRAHLVSTVGMGD